MFAPWCPRHRARVLLSESSIESLVNGECGPEVRFRCTCGERAVWKPQACAR